MSVNYMWIIVVSGKTDVSYIYASDLIHIYVFMSREYLNYNLCQAKISIGCVRKANYNKI